MRSDEFSEWMKMRVKKNSARDCTSRCKRVEKALEVDLDQEYEMDKGYMLLLKLSTYKKDDDKIIDTAGKFGFKSESNLKYRMADMKSAVNRYFKYLNEKN